MPDLSAVEAADAQNIARPDAPTTHPEWDRLVRTVWRLRQPDGCPWDREATHASLAPHMIEETYEALEAIHNNNDAELLEELGDLLEQVVLHAQVAADRGAFTIDDVTRTLNEKLVRRHPHVFGEDAAATSDEVLDIWEQIKAVERAASGDEGKQEPGLLDSIPHALPALLQCQKVSKRVVKAGFDWRSSEDVWQQFESETAEMSAEPDGSPERTLEFGDMLFSLINYGRKLGIDAEEALMASTHKFRRRWAEVERLARINGIDIQTIDRDVLEDLWNRAKAKETA